jgi:hypothetical protein
LGKSTSKKAPSALPRSFCLYFGSLHPGSRCFVTRSAAAVLVCAALDRDDFGSNRSKIMNVIDSKSSERDAGGKVRALSLITL